MDAIIEVDEPVNATNEGSVQQVLDDNQQAEADLSESESESEQQVNQIKP